MWRGNTILKKKKCLDCKISTLCGGGCAVEALMKNGDLHKPVCDNAPQVLRKYFDYLGEIYRSENISGLKKANGEKASVAS